MKRAWPTENDESDLKRVKRSKLSGKTSAHDMFGVRHKNKEHKIRSGKSGNRPEELVSNKRVSRLSGRDISGIEKKVVSIDPRFNKDLSDNAKEIDRAKYRTNYGFLNDMREQEISELQKQLKKTKDSDEKYEIRRKINEHRHAIDKFKTSERNAQLVKDFESKQAELASQGIKPQILSKRKMAMLGAAEKFLTMSDDKVSNIITKKRTDKAQKEKKFMPSK